MVKMLMIIVTVWWTQVIPGNPLSEGFGNPTSSWLLGQLSVDNPQPAAPPFVNLSPPWTAYIKWQTAWEYKGTEIRAMHSNTKVHRPIAPPRGRVGTTARLPLLELCLPTFPFSRAEL